MCESWWWSLLQLVATFGANERTKLINQKNVQSLICSFTQVSSCTVDHLTFKKNKADRITDSSFPVCLFPLMRTGGRLCSRTLPRRRRFTCFSDFIQNFSFSYCQINSLLIQNYELRGEKNPHYSLSSSVGAGGSFPHKVQSKSTQDERIRMSRTRIKVRGVLEESLGCSFLEPDDGGKAIVRPEGEERVPSPSPRL